MASSADQFLSSLLGDLLEQAKRTALPDIPSNTLRRALQKRRDRPGVGRLHITHYWALYVHDGRGPFRMPPGRFMVWFKDPRKDPRLRGGRPKRLNQVKRLRLRKGEFSRLLRAGEIVVASRITKATPPENFFSNEHTMRRFVDRAHRQIPQRFSKYVRSSLRDLGVR